jgi:hypothetical protein
LLDDAIMLEPVGLIIVANVVGVLGKLFSVIETEPVAIVEALTDASEVAGANGRSA